MTPNVVFAIALLSATALVTAAQSRTTDLKYDNDTLRFEYPAEWKLTDKSNSESQLLFLSRDGSQTLIVIASPRVTMQASPAQNRLQRAFFSGYIKSIRKSMGDDSSIVQEFLCTKLRDKSISGMKLKGFSKGEPTTGEVYPFVLNKRLITLVYMRNDKENAKSSVAWQKLTDTIYAGEGSFEVSNDLDSASEEVSPILNGSAVKLATVLLTKDERYLLRYRTISVRVVVDETGKVVSAEALNAPKSFAPTFEKAARQSKFSPTIFCEGAIRVTGIIEYVVR